MFFYREGSLMNSSPIILVRYFLLFMTTPYITAEHETFTLLILVCGTLNFVRLLMVNGLVNKDPSKYWPAFLVLLIVFISWCLLFVGVADSYIAAQGFVVATVAENLGNGA